MNLRGWKLHETVQFLDSWTKTAPAWEFSYDRSAIVRSFNVQSCNFKRSPLMYRATTKRFGPLAIQSLQWCAEALLAC